jgi:ankyrin repeat protein
MTFLLENQPLPQSRFSVFSSAIRVRSLRLVEMLLPLLIFNINEQNEDGNTLLLEAILLKAPEIAVKLLTSYRESMDVNIVNNDGQIAANLALPDFMDVFIKILESPFFNFSSEMFDASLGFLYCAAAGKFTAMKLLAERCTINPALKDAKGHDALSFALKFGNRPMIEFLLGLPGVTFPIASIRSPEPHYVLLALQLGRLDFATKIGHRSLLQFAIDHRHQPLFEFLMNSDEPMIGKMAAATLLQVIAQDLPEMFAAIVTREDMNLNVQSGFFELPLQAAIRSDNDVYFAILITDDRIDVNTLPKGAIGPETSFGIAVGIGKVDCVRAILERGCKDVNTQMRFKKTPYQIAKENSERYPDRLEWQEIVELLVKAGADTTVVTRSLSLGGRMAEKAPLPLRQPPAGTPTVPTFENLWGMGRKFTETKKASVSGAPRKPSFLSIPIFWPTRPS